MPTRFTSPMSASRATYPSGTQTSPRPATPAGEFGFILMLSLIGLIVSLLLLTQTSAIADEGLTDLLMLLS